MGWLLRLECRNGRIQALRKDRQGTREEGVTTYVSDWLECMEVCLGIDEVPTRSLWVKIKGKDRDK